MVAAQFIVRYVISQKTGAINCAATVLFLICHLLGGKTMRRVFVILQKEWIEIRQQWTLLFTIVLPPLFLTVLPLFVLAQFNRENLQMHGSVAIDYPSMQGMTFKEALQTQVGMQLSIMYVLLPGIITSVIASYSI